MVHNREWLWSGPIQFTVAGATLAILAAAATPRAVPDPILENQSAAITALRRIAAAQAILKSAASIETNCDGIGEYGYFEELAGVMPVRQTNGVCMPTAGVVLWDELDPPLLGGGFDFVIDRRVVHDGYLFQMWLPAGTAGGKVGAIAEDATGGKGAAPFPDPTNGARMWCCYAWPIDYDQTGRLAYFINQRGLVLKCRNVGAVQFEGTMSPPSFDEAYSVLADMSSPLRVGSPGGPSGQVWEVLD